MLITKDTQKIPGPGTGPNWESVAPKMGGEAPNGGSNLKRVIVG